MSRLTRRMVVAFACLAVGLGAAARLARAEGVTVDQASPEQKQAAQDKYEEAMTAFRSRRFPEALAGFRASYGVVASPNTRLMIVNVLEDQGDVVAAYQEALATVEVAEAAAAHDEHYAAAAQGARKVLGKLRARVGLVTVKVLRAAGGEELGPGQGSERLALTVAGKRIDRGIWGKPIAVAPGQCEVVLRSDTGPASKAIAVSAGADIEITIAPPAARRAAGDGSGEAEPGGTSGTGAAPDGAEPVQSGDRTVLLVSGAVIGAVGVAGGVLFAVFGSLAKSNYDDLVERCPADRCPAELQGQADTTRTQQLVANISLGAGVVGLVTGVSLLVGGFVVDSSPAEPPPEVSVSFGPGSVMVSGSF